MRPVPSETVINKLLFFPGDHTHHIHLPCRRLPAFSLKPLLIASPGPPQCFLVENETEVSILRTDTSQCAAFTVGFPVSVLHSCGAVAVHAWGNFHEQMRPTLYNPALRMKWYQKQQCIRGSSSVNPPPCKTFCSAAFCYEHSSINPFSLVNWGAGALSFWPTEPGSPIQADSVPQWCVTKQCGEKR